MSIEDLEKHKILLDDARQTYYNRINHFGNLSTKAGIILAIIASIVALLFGWFNDPAIQVAYKLTFLIFLSYAAYLAIRTMFVKSVKFMSIEVGLRNLAGYPRMQLLEWVKFLLREYSSFIKDIQKEYDSRNEALKMSFYFIGLSLIVYLLSLVLK